MFLLSVFLLFTPTSHYIIPYFRRVAHSGPVSSNRKTLTTSNRFETVIIVFSVVENPRMCNLLMMKCKKIWTMLLQTLATEFSNIFNFIYLIYMNSFVFCICMILKLERMFPSQFQMHFKINSIAHHQIMRLSRYFYM